LRRLVEMIKFYDFGQISINGVVYKKDVIVTGEKAIAGWIRKEGHLLQVADIRQAIEEFAPEIAIVGTGYSGMMRVPEETRLYLQKKGVELFIEKTKEACDLFNALSKDRRTLAALHLTC
jgi:hypothetical protein